MVGSFLLSKKIVNFFVSFVLFLLTTACVSHTQEHEELRSLYIKSNYTKALTHLESSSLKSSSQNRLLYLLEKGALLDKLKEKEKARRTLFLADRLIDKQRTSSISQTAASFLLNDSTMDYSGELFEIITLHSLLALSFIEEGATKQARVEAQQINKRLHEFTRNLGDKNNSYQKDAFALYLSGIIYEALGEVDDAIIDYKRSLRVYNSPVYKKFHDGEIKEQITKALYRLAKKRKREEITQKIEATNPQIKQKLEKQTGSLIVFHELGTLSPKRAKNFFFDLGSSKPFRFSFPYIAQKAPSSGETGLLLEKKFFQGTEAVNLNALASHTLEERRLRLMLKGTVRLLLKSKITNFIEDELGPLAGFLATSLAMATEVADTRGWMFLPKQFFITRVDLPPGSYKVRAVSDSLPEKKERTVKIKAGKLVLIRAS